MHEGYSKVFVALDGTEQQDFVLARAIKVAANNGAALIIGHVIDSTALESAGSYPADLVLCGARGLSSHKYALLGSISTFLLRNTDCDILVVK